MAKRGRLPDPGDYPPILTTEDVAEILDLHVDTVRRYVREGRIPAHRLGGTGRSQLYILRDELIDTLVSSPLASEQHQDEHGGD